MKTAASIYASLAVLFCIPAPAQRLVDAAEPQPSPTPTITVSVPSATSTAYRNQDLQFVYRYPAPLKQQAVGSFQEAMQRGHRETFTADALDPESAQTERCMHVLFYARTQHGAPEPRTPHHHPAATPPAAAKGMVTVGEFDKGCVPEGLEPNDALISIAAMPGQLPGFQPIDQQMWYELDKHKIHFLAAQGNFPGEGEPTRPMVVAVASVEVHDHLLFWMFMADNMPLLNQLLNSQVQFDSGRAEPLFPMAIGDGTPVKPAP